MKCIQFKSNGEVVRTSDEKAREMVRQERARYHPKKVASSGGRRGNVNAWTRYYK